MDLTIRKEEKGDYSEVTDVIDSAFGQKNEGRIVEALRRNPDFVDEL